MKIRKLLFICFFAFFFFSPVFNVNRALAINTGTVGILPAYPDPNNRETSSWFIYKLDLGQSKEDAVRVINNRQETAIIKLYAVDATITSDGAFALLPEDADRKDVGGWVKLALNEIEVPAKSEKLVPFTINIPKDADVGDHAGGIVMQEVEGKGQTLSGTGVKIITRVGVRIYETVPGEVRKGFAISRYDWQPAVDEKANFFKKLIGMDKKTHFFFGIENKGNVKISPNVKIEVKNMFRRKVGYIYEAGTGVIFPRTKTNDNMTTWNGMPYLGRYTAKLTVNFSDEAMGEQTEELVMWAFPYRLFIELVSLFVLIVLTRLTIQYFREIKKEKMPVYVVRPGVTLGILSKQFQVKWKKMAKMNNLEKPYEISAGQKLFIPINRKNREYLQQLREKGWLKASLREKMGGKMRSRKKKVAIAVVIVLVAAGASLYFFKFKKSKQVAAPPNQASESSSDQPQESADKISSGVLKKSAILVKVYTPTGGNFESSTRLRRKLELIGYQTELVGSFQERKYNVTIIEYGPGNSEPANILKNDSGISSQVDTKEVADIGKELIIYNLADKNEFLPIEGIEGKNSSVRDLIKVKLMRGGAVNEVMNKLKDLIFQGGYDISDQFGEVKSQTDKGLTIVYQNDDQKNNAQSLNNFLIEKGYQVSVRKANTSESLGDNIEIIVGKIVNTDGE